MVRPGPRGGVGAGSGLGRGEVEGGGLRRGWVDGIGGVGDGQAVNGVGLGRPSGPCSRAASAGVEGGLGLDDVQHDRGLAAGGPTLNLLAGGVAGARLAALTDRTSRTNTDRRVVACHDGSPVHPVSCAQRGWGTG